MPAVQRSTGAQRWARRKMEDRGRKTEDVEVILDLSEDGMGPGESRQMAAMKGSARPKENLNQMAG